MPGPLLKSATLKTYHPVGAVGHPVYLAAAQLRAAIARRLGAEIADVFAIPQRNEDGDTVDWYAPNPGTVVPWNAATETERAAAQSRLLEVRERIEDLGRSMEAEVSPERQVFGRLLAQVMQFPGEQDVHLVNGQPVLTFWGFVKDRAEVGSDPLRDLSQHLAPLEGAGKVARGGRSGAADEEGQGRTWWRWLLLALLLLMLLALLLWGLRGCEPLLDLSRSSAPSEEAMPDGEPPLSSERLATDRSERLDPLDEPRMSTDETRLLDPDEVRTDEMRTDAVRTGLDARDDSVDPDAARSSIRERVERTLVDDDLSFVSGVRSDVTAADMLNAEDGVDSVAVDADLQADRASLKDRLNDEATVIDGLEDAGPMSLGTDADASVRAEPISDTAAADSQVADEDADSAATEVPLNLDSELGPESASEQGKADKSTVADEASEADDAVALGEAPAPGTDAPAPAGADTASATTDATADAVAGAARAASPGTGMGASRAAGAVRIPPRELLNSGWRTSRTLQDPRDGSPVHLDYQLKDGAGQVRLIRKDGSICQSDAQAGVRDGRLVVDSQQDIVCADGTNFGRPQLDCTPQAGGRASCVGRYADGSSLPIEMRRQPD